MKKSKLDIPISVLSFIIDYIKDILTLFLVDYNTYMDMLEMCLKHKKYEIFLFKRVSMFKSFLKERHLWTLNKTRNTIHPFLGLSIFKLNFITNKHIECNKNYTINQEYLDCNYISNTILYSCKTIINNVLHIRNSIFINITFNKKCFVDYGECKFINCIFNGGLEVNTSVYIYNSIILNSNIILHKHSHFICLKNKLKASIIIGNNINHFQLKYCLFENIQNKPYIRLVNDIDNIIDIKYNIFQGSLKKNRVALYLEGLSGIFQNNKLEILKVILRSKNIKIHNNEWNISNLLSYKNSCFKAIDCNQILVDIKDCKLNDIYLSNSMFIKNIKYDMLWMIIDTF